MPILCALFAIEKRNLGARKRRRGKDVFFNAFVRADFSVNPPEFALAPL